MELDPKTTKKILFFIAFGAVCFAAVTNFEKVISVPVSYTHLDVYKRQILDIRR